MRPVLLDLYCCAGVGAEGYMRAGWDVIGVDLERHPSYPGAFVQGDALDALGDRSLLSAVHGIHASPPCQAYTQMSAKHRGTSEVADSHAKLISATREALQRTGRPWVIENVVGARGDMPTAIVLTGGQFGLRVYRPRLFEASGFTIPVLSKRPPPPGSVGVYGRDPDGRLLWTRKDGSELRCAASTEDARVAMGIERKGLTWREIAEGIPPAYTEHVGRAMLGALRESSRRR